MKRIKKLIKRFFLSSTESNLDFNTAQYVYEVTQKNALEKLANTMKHDLAIITFQYDTLKDNFEQAKSALNEYGIVIIENAFSENDSTNVTEKFETVKNEVYLAKEKKTDIETTQFYVDVENMKFKTYKDKSDFDKTLFDIRSGADEGMIDVFNYDYLDEENGKKLRTIFESNLVLKLIESASGKRYSPKNLNLYYNQNIVETRGFHVDSYSRGQMKAFIYLTDVVDNSYGPYSYVLKSHNDAELEKFNKSMGFIGKRAKTDAYFLDTSNAFPILGKRGTLVISDQGGIHRGHPQEEGKQRMVAVLNYIINR